MTDTLLMKKVPIQRVNPKISLFYSKPKMGKTFLLSTLEDCLTLATEDGVEMYEMLYYRVTSIDGPTTYHQEGELKGQIKTTSLNHVYGLFLEEAGRQKAAGQVLRPPFKYIAIDTIDELETMCEVSATVAYKASTIGKTFEGKSVIELPNGNGYYNLRNEVLARIDQIAGLCKGLILISHMKDKVQNKGGIEVVSTDISLTGKLGAMISARADIIGYLYQMQNKDNTATLWVSFESYDKNSVMGSRFKRLAGQKFPFSWDKIFIPE